MPENMKVSQSKTKVVRNADFTDPAAYRAWRQEKIARSDRRKPADFVEIANLATPSNHEVAAMLARINDTGFALYSAPPKGDDLQVSHDLRSFTDAFGLRVAEKHRSTIENGVVALQVSDKEHQRGYIPYSRKAINWHTDGYYNGPDQVIRSFILHCVRPADDGGRNQIIDPEIAYIRLRDLNPDYVTLLMDNAAMTIPPNTEKDGSVRPASIGPVFFLEDGALTMRYTARTRSIEWKDGATLEAARALQHILETEQDYLHSLTLAPGQGVLSNNCLHNRTGFDPEKATGTSERLLYRIRFHNRIEGSPKNGQAK